ncbi:hypothetical protein N0V84_009341 [Fusarium piperis]|uniref:Rhodopsin domain-containing protein n=1 Tax=Fusarium piperis TaxID=1435070 RepID=A0A9W9BIB8_9HYPO|nr:hypothetical protein N0V84_009341 [Fusarium piperis]
MAILLLALEVSMLARWTTAAEMASGRLSACTRFLSDACHAPIRDQSDKVLAIASVFSVLAIAAIAARLYTRNLVVGKVVLGDYLAILNLLTALSLSSIIIYGKCLSPGLRNEADSPLTVAQIGLGKHIFQLEFDQITRFLHLFYVGVPIYHTTTVLTKIVILLLYKRVFGIDPVFLRIAYGTGIVCIAYWLSFLAVDIFQCTPVSYAWTRWDGEHQGSCIAYLPATYAVAIINIVLDVWGAGDYVAIGYYSTIEASVGVICTCMPDIRTLLIRFWPAISGSTYPNSSEHYSGQASSAPGQNRSPGAPSGGVGHITSTGGYNKQREINIHEGRRRALERSDIDSVSAIELIEVESASRIGAHSSNDSWESLGRQFEG